MSNLKVAIDCVIRQEDARMTGEVTILKGDTGGATRWGIAIASHPELVASGFFDASRMGRDQSLAVAEKVYETVYANPLHCKEINDEGVCVAVLSFGINAGESRAAKCMEQACGKLGHPLTVDGRIGPATIAAVNASDPDTLIAAFIVEVDAYYDRLAATHPNDRAFLNGWHNRAALWRAQAEAVRKLAAA